MDGKQLSTWRGLINRDGWRGGPQYGELLAAPRVLQARLAAATPPPEVLTELIAQITSLNDLLDHHQSSEAQRWDGWRFDLPGNGSTLVPPYVLDPDPGTSLSGHVTFSRFYLGGNGAAHGGAICLLFDELLGMAANQTTTPTRTAYLKVDFRQVTPLEVELRFSAVQHAAEGRKHWITGRLEDSEGTLLAEADGLFIELKPGQP